MSSYGRAAVTGAAAGLVGAAAMAAGTTRDELLVDVGAKSLYALVTGAVADALVEPSPESSVRRAQLERRLKGFA